MKNSKLFILFISIAYITISCAQEKAVPVFKDGEAQIVDAFNTPDEWIRHDLWVETEFDTDGDGKQDIKGLKEFIRYCFWKTTKYIVNNWGHDL